MRRTRIICVLLLIALVGCTAAPAVTPLAPPPAIVTTSAPAVAPTSAPAAPLLRDAVKITVLGINIENDEARLTRSMAETNKFLRQRSLPIVLDSKLFVPQNQAEVFETFTNSVENTIMVFGANQYATLAATGGAADITEHVKQFDKLYATYQPNDWKSAAYNGRIYGLPLLNRELTPRQIQIGTSLVVRQDVLDQLGAPPPKTPQELVDMLDKVKAAGHNPIVAYSPNAPAYALHRAYDEWPFFVSQDSMFVYDHSTEVKPYLGSAVFDKDSAILRQINAQNRLMMLRTTKEFDDFEQKWNAFASLNIGLSYADSPMADKLTVVTFEPDKPSFQMRKRVDRFLCISPNTKDVTPVLEALEAIYTDQETHDALHFGEKGIDWTLNADGSVNAKAASYLFHGPMLHPAPPWPYPLIDPNTSAGVIIDMPGTQFNFFPEMELYTKVVNARGSQGRPGILSSRFDNISDDMKKLYMNDLEKSGYAALLEQCQKQYDAFLAN